MQIESRVKSIRIPIPEYKIFHAPSDEEKIDPKFISRQNQVNNFVEVIKSSANKKGKYLISGDRGVGKTSFVNKVINKLNKKNSKTFHNILITFNDELQTERDVLIQIIKRISEIFYEIFPINKIIFLLITTSFSILTGFSLLALLKAFDSNYKALILGVLHLLFVTLTYIYTRKFEPYRNIKIGKLYQLWVIYREIRKTKNNVNAKVLKESGLTLKGRFFNIGQGVKKDYGLLTVIDLEERIAKWTTKLSDRKLLKNDLQFIVTFDELDKLKMINNDDNVKDIVHLFSKMKTFLTNTHAKFIFISGNEMHQRYLDTYTDRSNMLISIIDREEQISSFLSSANIDNTNNSFHIFHTIEQYVCNNIIDGSKNLYELVSHFNCNNSQNQVKHTLYHFVNYLYFVSHGNPKKLMIHFEKQMKFMKAKPTLEDFVTLSPKENNSSNNEEEQWYFCLSYNDQLRNSFINYLTSPINYAILKEKQNFSDNLLVAASFFLGYIYKYHKNSFSLRNKEQFPEIFQTNNTTDIRELVDIIIQFLGKNHIQSILSSVFRYKLPIKITEEIKNITKLSEDTSTIFNFSHSEFSNIKKHYLTQIEAIENNIHRTDQNGTVSSLYHIIGDSELFSENINEAIIAYRNSSSILEKHIDNCIATKQLVPYSHLTEFIRVQLKLGLVYEKRETYSTAQNIYSSLTTKINNILFIDLKSIGLNLTEGEGYNEYGNKKEHLKYNRLYKNDKKVDVNRYLLEDGYNNNQTILNNLSYSENLRMITQPLLTRLFIREKTINSEIKIHHIDRTEFEFSKIYFLQQRNERFIIPADFYKRLADIIYYKNDIADRLENTWQNMLYFYDLNDKRSLLTDQSSTNTRPVIIDDELNNQVNKHISNSGNNPRITNHIKNCLKNRDLKYYKSNKGKHRFTPACMSCKYYTRSLRHLLRNFTHISPDEIKSTSKIELLFRYLEKNKILLRRTNYLQIMATTLSSLGDNLLTCCTGKNAKLGKDFLEDFEKLLINKLDGYHIFSKRLQNNTIEKVLLYYYLSGRFYLKSGKHSEYMFQLKKILLVFSESNTEHDLIKNICIRVLKEIKICQGEMYGHSTLLEEKKLHELFEEDSQYKCYSSNYADIEDAIYITKEALIKDNDINDEPFFKEYFSNNKQPLTTVYNRMLRLRLNAEIYKHELDLDFKSVVYFKDENLNKTVIKNENHEKIIDAIFCLKKFTEFIAMQNNTKLFTNSIISQVYFDLAKWIELLLKVSEQIKSINPEISPKIEEMNLKKVDSQYYYDKSISYYYKAIEIHTQGQAYQDMIDGMHIINDDLNDDVFHFFIALERYRFNTGKVDHIYDYKTETRNNNGE